MTTDPQPAALKTEPAPNPIWTRLSVVWLVPLLALAITLGIAWKTYADRGMLIEIDFADATGIVPGETTLKFREVDVGKVESVGFSPDLTSVRVGVRVNKDVAQYIDDEARFWVVRPEVTTQGISRLDTVLSGAFITLAIVMGEFTMAALLNRPAFGPFMQLLGANRAYEPPALAVIAFAITWGCMGLIQLVTRFSKHERAKV